MRHLALTPEKPGRRAREIRRPPVVRAQRRERRRQPLDHQLEEPLPAREVPQGVDAKIDDGHTIGKPLPDGLSHSAGQQDLTAMSGSHDPRAAMQVQAFVALPGQNRLAGVEPHPHAHRRARRPGMLSQRFLRLRRCRDRPPRQREDRMEPVALRAQLDSAVSVDRAAQEGPMDAEHRGPPIA